jgi:uncharacterized protein YbcV (DUF1398 family)
LIQPYQIMNTEFISAVAGATHQGTISFPEVVERLIAAGVEYYHVDYDALRKSFYSGTGAVAETPITYENLPPVAPDLDRPAVRAAILDSQRHGQCHREFSHRVMAAGVQSYTAYLRGRRVCYLGRQGDLHTEWFPGAEPGAPESGSLE